MGKIFGMILIGLFHFGFLFGQSPSAEVDSRAILLQFLTEKLGLDENQRVKIEEVLLVYEKEIASLEERMRNSSTSAMKVRYQELLEQEVGAIEEFLTGAQMEIFQQWGIKWREQAFQWWKEKQASSGIQGNKN